jgi:hypothetical protein
MFNSACTDTITKARTSPLSPSTVTDTPSPSFDKVKSVWEKIQAYLDVPNDNPTSFYQYLKKKNALTVNPTRSAVDRISQRQREFVSERIKSLNLPGNSIWAKKLMEIPRFNFFSLDDLSNLVSDVSLERACALGLNKYVEQMLEAQPLCEESFKEFADAFLEIKDKGFQRKLLRETLTKPQFSPYLDFLRENCFESIYSLLRREIADFSNEDHYLPKELRVQKLFAKVCVPSYLQGVSLALKDFKAIDDVKWIKGRIGSLPASLKSALKELGVILPSNQIREGLSDVETKQIFVNGLRFLGREFEPIEGASWESEFPSKVGKKRELFSSLELDSLDLGVELKSNCSFVEQCGAKRDLETIYLLESLKIAQEMEIPLKEEEKHDIHLSQDLRLISDLTSKIPKERISAAVKQKVKSLYEELFSKELPASSTTYEAYLLFKRKFTSLYSDLKSKIVDSTYLALIEKAYTLQDAKLLKAVERDLSHYLIPTNEVEILSSNSEEYLRLDQKIASQDRRVLNHFMSKCLGRDPSTFASPDDALEEFQDFLKSSNLVKKFFISKGALQADGSLLFLNKVDGLRNIQTYIYLLFKLLSEAGKAQGKEVQLEEGWGYNDLEDIYRDLSPLNLDAIEKELNLSHSSNPFYCFSETKTPRIFSFFQSLGVIHKSGWDFQMNFVGKYKVFQWLIQMLKDNSSVLFPKSEAAEREQNLEEMLESGDTLAIEGAMHEIYSKVCQFISTKPDKKYTLERGVSLLVHLRPETGVEELAICGFENETWQWIQASSFRHSLNVKKEFNQKKLSQYEKMLFANEALESFYSQCATEIARYDMPPVYLDFLERAVSFADTKACTWIFQKIAYERYLSKLDDLSISHLPNLNNPNWTIENVIQKTKVMLNASDIDTIDRKELLHSLDSFPVELDEIPEDENVETLPAQIVSYLSNNSTHENSFLSYLRDKGFSPDQIGESELTSFYQIFREFIEVKIQEVESTNSIWKKGLISELEECKLDQFIRLDFIDKILRSQSVEEGFEIAIKGKLTSYLTRVVSEAQVSPEFFKEKVIRILDRSFQIELLKSLLLDKSSTSYVKYLVDGVGNSIKSIAYDALGSLAETSSVSATEVFRALLNNLIHISQSNSEFLIEIRESTMNLISLARILVNDRRQSILKEFFIEHEMLDTNDFIEIDSCPRISKRIQRSLRLLMDLNKVTNKNVDTLALSEEITKRAYFTFILSLSADSNLRIALTNLYKQMKKEEISLEKMMLEAQVLLDENRENISPDALKVHLKKATELTDESKVAFFPWKPIANPNSALAQEVARVGINQRIKGSLLEQYLDGQEFLDQVKNRCHLKKGQIEALFEGVSSAKQRRELTVKLKNLHEKLTSISLPDGTDTLAEVADELIQLEVLLSGVDQGTIANRLLNVWEIPVNNYFKWSRDKFTNPPRLKPAVFPSLYERFLEMKFKQRYTYQILKQELSELKLPEIYGSLLSFSHHIRDYQFTDWLTKRILYAKYEKNLGKGVDQDLHDLFTSIESLPIDEKLARTKYVLSLKQGESYEKLLESLQGLSWENYLTKR